MLQPEATSSMELFLYKSLYDHNLFPLLHIAMAKGFSQNKVTDVVEKIISDSSEETASETTLAPWLMLRDLITRAESTITVYQLFLNICTAIGSNFNKRHSEILIGERKISITVLGEVSNQVKIFSVQFVNNRLKIHASLLKKGLSTLDHNFSITMSTVRGESKRFQPIVESDRHIIWESESMSETWINQSLNITLSLTATEKPVLSDTNQHKIEVIATGVTPTLQRQAAFV